MIDRMLELNPDWISVESHEEEVHKLNPYKRIHEVMVDHYNLKMSKGQRKGYRVHISLLQKMYLDIMQNPRGFKIHPSEFCYSERAETLGVAACASVLNILPSLPFTSKTTPPSTPPHSPLQARLVKPEIMKVFDVKERTISHLLDLNVEVPKVQRQRVSRTDSVSSVSSDGSEVSAKCTCCNKNHTFILL